MELNNLKNTWNETNSPAQQNINPDKLKKMDQTYRAKMKRILVPEMIGIIVCVAAAVFIGFHFYKLDTLLLQGAGVLSILLLLLLPIISLISTGALKNIGDVNKPYAETLKAFALQKIRFIKWQKINVTLSYLLLVVIIVLLSRLFSGRDLSGNTYYWLFSFTIGYIFLLFYSKWVDKHYRKTLRQAEELLSELAA